MVARSSANVLLAFSRRSLHIACIVAAVLTVLGFSFGAIWAHGEWGTPFTWDARELGAIAVAVAFIAAAVATRRDSQSAGPSLAIATAGGGLVLAAWFGAAAHKNGNPVLLMAVGFGGLAVALALAVFAMRSRDVAHR
jgi:hypothetical protein